MYFLLVIGILKKEESNTKYMLLIVQGVSCIYLNVMETLSVLEPQNIWASKSH